MKVKCDYCGKKFERLPCYVRSYGRKHAFCSRECYYKWIKIMSKEIVLKRKETMMKRYGRLSWNKGLKGVQVAWNKGLSPPKKTREKISKTLKDKYKRGELKNFPLFKGKKVDFKEYPNFGMRGKHFSKESKRKMSSSHKKFLKDNEQFLEKLLKKLVKRPTKLEQRFIGFFKQHNLPFTYCGNGSLIIGGRCPDFYENNGKKICLEVGNKPEKEFHKKISWEEYERQRINHFLKYGWKCAVIWEHELQNPNRVIERIRGFL